MGLGRRGMCIGIDRETEALQKQKRNTTLHFCRQFCDLKKRIPAEPLHPSLHPASPQFNPSCVRGYTSLNEEPWMPLLARIHRDTIKRLVLPRMRRPPSDRSGWGPVGRKVRIGWSAWVHGGRMHGPSLSEASLPKPSVRNARRASGST